MTAPFLVCFPLTWACFSHPCDFMTAVRSLCAKSDLINGGRSSAGVNQPLMSLGFDWFTSHYDSVFTSRLKIKKNKQFMLQPFHTGLHNKYIKLTISFDPNFGVKFSVTSWQMTTTLLIVCSSRQILIHEVSLNQKHYKEALCLLLLCAFGHCS